MNPLFVTNRLNIYEALESEISQIIALENDPENSNFIWQGTYKEHLNETLDKDSLLLTFKAKENSELIGYCLIKLNNKSKVFELRRIAINKKGMGFGREAMNAILGFCFKTLKMNRFWLDVYPDNIVGIKLYKSLGLVHEGTLRQSYKSERGYLNQMIFSMLREEFLK